MSGASRTPGEHKTPESNKSEKDMQYQRVFDSWIPMPHGALLRRLHAFKQPQLLGGKRQPSLMHHCSRAIEHQGFLRM